MRPTYFIEPLVHIESALRARNSRDLHSVEPVLRVISRSGPNRLKLVPWKASESYSRNPPVQRSFGCRTPGEDPRVDRW